MPTREQLQQRVWYHLYPLGFLEAEASNSSPGAPDGEVTHRLPAIGDWLDELADLGIGGLQLGPVFESETHGYDVVDATRIDRRLGDADDLHRLVTACHDRGLAVLLDGVFNHVGRAHPAYQRVVAEREHAATAGWFHLDFSRPGPDGFRYRNFEGHDRLVALDHDNPEVLDWAVDIASRWLDLGVDGWRLDAAYEVPTRFWAAFAERVRDRHPDAYLVGEVIRGDFERFVDEGRLDSVTQYELWKAIYSSLNDGNFFELQHALTRHQELVRDFAPWTFLGNHDTTRIATQLDDWRHGAHALTLLLMLPGTPAIYAGDEQAAQGTKRHEVGGDDEIRRPPPHRPGQLPDDARGMRDLHQQLIGIRRDRPWLARADLEVVDLENESIVIDVCGNAHHRLRIALNVGTRPIRVTSRGFRRLAGQDGPQLPPHGWTVREPTR